jgi:signal transduction histidine kinase
MLQKCLEAAALHCSAALRAVGSILSALRGEEAVQECRVIQKKSGTALDLRVWAFPLNIESQSFVLFVVHDISHEKQKRIFERMFYHDIMNTVTGLQTYTEALPYALNGDNKLNLQDIFIRMNKLSGRLADEINAQKELMTAENNELVVRPGTVNSLALLHELLESNRVLQIALGKKIVVDTGAQNIDFISDDRLLMRVIGNMVVNALEAIDSEQSVNPGM